MNKKRVFQYILTLFFLLFFITFSGAQEGESSLVISKTERRYIQRLAWEGDKNTLRYEIQVDKEEGGTYTRIRQVYTDESFVELSLQPGYYRCRVIPYDFLNRPGEGSEWLVFEIPVIIEIETPKPGEEETLIAEAEIETELEDEEIEEVEEPEPVKKEKPLDFYINLAWMPIIPVYGKTDQFADWSNTLLCGGLRLGMVTTLNHSIEFGLEFAITRYYFDIYSHGWYENDNSWYVEAFELILLAQKWFPKKITALNIRFGGGYLSLTKSNSNDYYYYDEYYYDGYYWNNIFYDDPSVNLSGYYLVFGLSFLWRPVKHFYMETGIDYIHLFDQGSFGFFRPSVGLGVRF